MTMLSPFNIIVEQEGQFYIFNTISDTIICLSKSFFSTLNDLTKSSEIPPNKLDILYAYKIITKNVQMDLSEILEKKMRKINRDSELEIMIHPTLKCNISCSYCYQAEIKKEEMSLDVIEQLIAFIDSYNSQHPLKSIQITWSGGEPILAFDSIKYFVEKTKFIFPDLFLNMKLITNGILLTNNIIQELFLIDIRNIQITIDGLFEQHNDRRSIDNFDSFSIIMRNIDNILINYPLIHLTLRVNLDKTNKDNYPDIFNYFTEKYQDRNWNLFPEFVHNYNTENSPEMMNREEKIAYLFNLIEEKIFSPEYLFSKEVGFCMNKSKYSFAIAPDGGIYKCETNVGLKEYAIAHISEYATVLSRKIPHVDDVNQYPLPKCLNCSLLPMCNYGCLNYQENERCHILKGHEEKFLLSYLKDSFFNNTNS
jgi:uncharacterized protein